MRTVRTLWLAGSVLVLTGIVAVVGCGNTPPYLYYASRSPAPLREPPLEQPGCKDSYEDSLTGGKIFTMYCSYCHNAPAVAERPFSNFQNVAAHMRVRANLTGKEYAKLLAWLRKMHDVPDPTSPVEPSPKRFFFSQPIAELRKQGGDKGAGEGKAKEEEAIAAPPATAPQP
jgi:hypothetical protein